MSAVMMPLLRAIPRRPSSLEDEVSRIVRDECALDEYIISKSLVRPLDKPASEGGYAFPKLMEVCQVSWKLIAMNGEAAAPQLNDRVPYVYRYDPSEPCVAAKAECPLYVAAHTDLVKIDRPKYIEKAMTANAKLFETFPESHARVLRTFKLGAEAATMQLQQVTGLASFQAPPLALTEAATAEEMAAAEQERADKRRHALVDDLPPQSSMLKRRKRGPRKGR